MHTQDIPYLPENGTRGLLDVSGPDDARNCPTAILIHGGGLVEYSKERMGGIAEFLVRHGWAVANINYRLLTDAPYPAALQDALAAVEWVATGVDPYLSGQNHERPLLLGASAGGFLALMAGFLLSRRRVCAVVSISGPTLPGRYGANVPHGENDPRLFMAPTTLAFASADVPPTLLIHSRNDRLVEPREAIELAEVLAQAGAPPELYLFDGSGELHGIWREERAAPELDAHIEDRIIEFVNRLP